MRFTILSIFVLSLSNLFAACDTGDGGDDDGSGNSSEYCDAIVSVQTECGLYYLETGGGYFDSVSACEGYYNDDREDWFRDCGSCLEANQSETCGDIDDACMCNCCSTCSSECD